MRGDRPSLVTGFGSEVTDDGVISPFTSWDSRTWSLDSSRVSTARITLELGLERRHGRSAFPSQTWPSYRRYSLYVGHRSRDMTDHAHPPRDAVDWEHPDFCPFCGTELVDGGAGFIDHVGRSPECRDRFAVWRERVAKDIGGEWGG